MVQPVNSLDTEDQASLTSVRSVDPSPDTLTSMFGKTKNIEDEVNLICRIRTCKTPPDSYFDFVAGRGASGVN